MASYLDLVPVEQSDWLRAHPHAVDEYIHGLIDKPDRHLAVRKAYHNGVPRRDILARQYHVSGRVTPDDHLTNRYGLTLSADFHVRHRVPSSVSLGQS
jgi:hypothetical protein